MRSGFIWFLVLLLSASSSVRAESKAEFCDRMYAQCLTKCPPGSNCRSCPGKLADCRVSGCFAFLTAGTRCITDAARPARQQ